MTQPGVVVVGSGVSGLCAAIAAAEQGATTTVLEKAPKEQRGGNTFFAGGGLRFAYNGLEDIARLLPDISIEERSALDVGRYTSSQFLQDLVVDAQDCDVDLVQVLVDDSYGSMVWLLDRGVRFAPAYHHSYKEHDQYRFRNGECVELAGAGCALSDVLHNIAENRGVEIRYDSAATRLLVSGASIVGVEARTPEGDLRVEADAVVMAAGGFEANAEMRAMYLGPEWRSAKVRGSRYNTGEGLQMALDVGAKRFGRWSGAHAIPWDSTAPPFGDRSVISEHKGLGTLKFHRNGYPLGITVNVRGERFFDEGADLANFTFTEYGSLILRQPEGLAFQIFDQNTVELLRADYYRFTRTTRAEALTIEHLAVMLGIDPMRLKNSVEAYNHACEFGPFDPNQLDGLRAAGIDPPKSNWAVPLDRPPYIGFAVCGGISFTYGGLHVDKQARVLDTSDQPIRGLYAVGEMIGGLFSRSYPSGAGLVAGSVFGKIAGTTAASAQ